MKKSLLTALLGISCAFTFAQTQLTNLNSASALQPANPRQFFTFNNILYFAATHDKVGNEIWRSDGTPEGTVLLKDINIGKGNSIISNFVELKGKMYFIADDGVWGYQLWVTDGSSTGTKRVTNNIGYAVTKLVVSGNFICYLKKSSDNLQVWKSDGTQDGTVLVKGDIPVWNTPDNLIAAIGLVFFSAQDQGTNDSRVWRTDGTDAGTFAVTGLLDGNGAALGGTTHPTQFAEYNGALYFVVRSMDIFSYPMSVGIMKTDGTVAGTRPVKSIHEGNLRLIDFAGVVVYNDAIYFSFFEQDYNRFFVWRSQGLEANTTRVYDQYASSYFSPSNISPLGGSLYFTAGNNNGGTSLARYNISTGQSDLLQQVAGPIQKSSFFIKTEDPSEILSYNNILFVRSIFEYGVANLWVSNGQPGGTSKLSGVKNVRALTTFKANLYFSGAENSDFELWRSDGSAGGTTVVKDLNPAATGAAATSLVPFGDRAVFQAYDNISNRGYELWTTDGTVSGTGLLADLYPGTGSSGPYNFVRVSNKIYFTAGTPSGKREVYVTDGTTQGTKLTTTLSAVNATVSHLVPLDGNNFYIIATSNSAVPGIIDSYVYKSDGTSEGTVLIVKSGYITRHAVVNSALYFINPSEGDDLWKTNGTPGSTVKVKDLTGVENLTAAGNMLYFTAVDYPTAEKELYKSDGTPQGTVLVKNLNGSASSEPANLFAYGNKLAFTAIDQSSGREVWITDGTAERTSLLKDTYVGAASGVATPMFATAGNILYFVARNEETGSELWTSDGTTTGTVPIDILPGAESSKPTSLASTSGSTQLYFSAYTPQAGYELWRSDGTAEGTLQVVDILPGDTHSSPYGFVQLNDNLLFFANTDASGVQLWRYNLVTSVLEPGNTKVGAYPNPTTGLFTISSHNTAGGSVAVYNLSGVCVYTSSQPEAIAQVDIKDLPSGLYLLHLSRGSYSVTTKIIKL